jgi:beta-galactosidase
VIAPRSTEEGWTRIDAVCEPGSLRLYVAGTEVGTLAHDVGELDGRGPVRIGRDRDGDAHAAVTVDAVTVVDAAREVESPAPGDPDDVVAEYDFAALLRDQALMGGFIWDWVNQDVDATTVVDGEEIQYQDYDDDPFCLNGLVWSDRTPTPALSQLKYNHQPVGFAAADAAAGDLYVTNHHGFTDLSEYDVTWELTQDDEVIQSGSLDLDVPPGETRRISVPLHDPLEPTPGAEYHLSLSVTTTDEAPYADAGFEVASEQLPVPFDSFEAAASDDGTVPPVSVTEGDGTVTVDGENFEYVFDTDAGTLSNGSYEGTTIVERGPLFNAWRVPIMNESQSWGGEQASSWYEAGLDDLTQTVESVDVTVDESVATVEIEGAVRGDDLGALRRTDDAAGTYATAHGDLELVDGVAGQAVSFEGESHLTVERSDPPTLDSGLTLECWVRPGESGAGDPQPYVIAGGQYLLKRRAADRGGELEFAVYSDAWRTVAVDVPDDWTEAWHHVAGVWDSDADELRVYLDGEHRGTTEFGNELGEFDGRVRVGRDRESFVADGTAIDEVRVYDRGLDPADVGELDAPPEAFTHLPLDAFETIDRSTPSFETRYRYRVYGTGDLTVEVEADPNQSLVDTVDDYLPKVGLRTELPRAFDRFEWFGRGPTETYPDRKSGTPVGRYEGSVDEQYVPYIPPTDNGNKTDTRWAALSNGEVGLLGAPLEGTTNVNLEQWANLDEADHEHELEARETVALDLDHAVSGVGGTPVQLNEDYQVKPEPVSFGVRLRPFTDEDPMDLAREGAPVDGDE